jgi:hypothetical protein
MRVTHPSLSDLEVILIREDLLTTLTAGSTLLLLLAELRACKKGKKDMLVNLKFKTNRMETVF